MTFRSLRALGGAALGLVLAACAGDRSVVGPAGAPLLDVSGGSPIVINEIMANPTAVSDAVGEWFEIHNRGTADVDLQGWRIASANDAVHVVNAPLVVPAGGYAVLVRSGDPAVNGGVNGDYSYEHATFNLNNSNTDWLALRDPSGASVDSVAWGTSSPPSGASRGVIDAGADNTVMSESNWSDQTSVYGSGDRGTPGVRNDGAGAPPPPPPPPGTGALVLNEVLADPNAVSDAAGEWFEVHNASGTAVDMNGWTLASRNDVPHVVSASVVVPAGGYVVLGRNADTLTNGGVKVDYVYAGATTLNLANSSDWLAIRDGTGAGVDSVEWSTTQPRGASRAVIDPSADNTDVGGGNWTNSTQRFGAGDRGTPGAANGTVAEPPPAGTVASVSVAINSPRLLPVGYTKPAFPTARDGAGTIITPPPAYTWTSSDISVAGVDSLGYVSAVSPGRAFITATAPNGVAGTTSLDVIPATASTTAVYRNHVEFGIPAVAGGMLLSKPQFSAMYSTTRGGPAWVSWNLNATQFGSVPRCDCFSSDRTLPTGVYRVFDFDYRGSGYDRGHMVQSESRTTTLQENASTFLLTNILPQAGENNQGPWLRFENHLNDLARLHGREVYVVAGGEYSAAPQTLKGEGRVQIPEWTWKVAVVMEGGRGLADVRGTGDLQVLAIRMPNDTAGARGIRNNPWEMYATTVDEIEARTGLDLLSALPENLQRVVESAALQGVATLLERVEAMAASGELSRGNVGALGAKLSAAEAALVRGNLAAARGQLGAFVSQVDALVSAGRLSGGAGAELKAAAERILRGLGG